MTLLAGDTTYTLSLSTNALCELEDLFDKSVSEIAEMFGAESVSMKTVRAVVWACLQDNHPDVDLRKAGLIITEAGMMPSMEAVGKAFKSAFPTSDSEATEKTGSHPRKAKAGAG